MGKMKFKSIEQLRELSDKARKKMFLQEIEEYRRKYAKYWPAIQKEVEDSKDKMVLEAKKGRRYIKIPVSVVDNFYPQDNTKEESTLLEEKISLLGAMVQLLKLDDFDAEMSFVNLDWWILARW